MKYHFERLILLLIVLGFLLCGCSDEDHATSGVNSHSAIVQELVSIVSTDNMLANQIDTALKEQEEGSFWAGKTLEDMYDFFDQWLVFTPVPDNTREYMDNFYEFANSEQGKAVVVNKSIREWLYEFMLARGEFMDSGSSTATLSSWLDDPEVKIDDFIVPAGGFKSFNEFFTRRLKPGVRPIDDIGDNNILTSPADCTVMNISDNITDSTVFNVKGDSLNINLLLGEDELADVFIGGRAILCMLSTTDYHRFHSPVQGRIVSEKQLAGLYYGMTDGWVDYFFEHRRGYMIFETEKFGYVGMVSVGMFTISSIQFIKYQDDVVSKGDELGNFAYGGSAIILLFEPDRVEFSSEFEYSPFHFLMGEKIGSAVPAP